MCWCINPAEADHLIRSGYCGAAVGRMAPSVSSCIMSTDEHRLREALSGRYTVETPIGVGGMATVYLARDLKHGREVAIKVLRPELAGMLGAERFLREIAVTASLDHPNILPLLDSGDADGLLFYVMPMVKGESLRNRLTRERQLPVEESLHIIGQVSAALAYAHSRGIIHRDIKPENIMLAEGQARVVDFGIARMLSAVPGQAITGTGIVVGSPAYMSPEQAAGERDVDGRSDVYASACVLYEMLAGVPPFAGPTFESLMRQHLVAPPPDVHQLRPSVPATVVTAVTRALSKAPADRFSSPALFAAALTAAHDSPLPATNPAALLSQRAVERDATRDRDRDPDRAEPITRYRERRWLRPVLAGTVLLVVAIVGGRYVRDHRPVDAAAKPRVAVLPFRNIGAVDDEYFADGITEEITSRLSTISGISVVSRTTALTYKGTTKPLREIARELGVAYILEGTVRTERRADGSGQLRVTPELMPADSDAPIWTDRFTVGIAPGALFAVQAQIAERVANAFNISIGGGERAALQRRETNSTDAHNAFLQGRFSLTRGTEGGVFDAMRYFKLAIAADSAYARAWAGLASAYARAPFYPDAAVPDSVAFDLAEQYARRAIYLDSSLAEGYVALASVLSTGRWQLAAADTAIRKALVLDPDNAAILSSHSSLLLSLRRYDEALEEADRALRLEPASWLFRHTYAVALTESGRLDEAVANERIVLAANPSFVFAYVWLGEIAALKGSITGMGRELEPVGPLSDIARAMMKFDGSPASRAAIVSAITSLRSPNVGLDASRKGWLLAAIGERNAALDAFDVALRFRSGPAALQFPTVRKALGALPRYQAMLQRAGIAP